ncbi:MAG: hypothetical protein IJ232_03330 [Lachnospiraceae bacterium]|nr:hypothetical protein [Lachnospiraceae bacterium]
MVKYFNETVDTDSIGELLNSLWDSDEKSATETVSELLWNTISYNDYHEDYYHHAFLKCRIKTVDIYSLYSAFFL